MPGAHKLCVWLLATGLMAGVAVAQTAQPKSAAKPAAKGAPAAKTASAAKATPAGVKFEEHKLKNGLRVILAPDHSAPTFAINVTYNVGSRDERPGRTGFAHLFEHMMFQGSENVGKGEHFILVLNNGGDMNGTTNQDRTNYFEAMPANQLDLGLFLESDRMKALAITQANLDNQRNAVQEERRLGMDNQPYGKTSEVMLDTVYDNFAYKHSTIGSMKDLDAATLEDVREFFKTYYAPNNAVLTLVGDFDPKVALAKVEKYFGAIPSQPAPKPVDMTEPEQKGERRKTIEDNFAQIPRVDIVFKVPQGNTPEYFAADVLGDILAGGPSSRLYQKLVKEKELAVMVGGGTWEHRGPSLEIFSVMMRPGKDIADVEKVVYEELARVAKDGVTKEEVERIHMQNRRALVMQKQRTLGRANLLGQYAVFYNDPNLINTLESKYAKVTAADVQSAAQKYLTENNRSVIITMPKPAAPAGKPGL